MTDEEKIQKLAAQFAEFGADNPISWATSEVKEGIPQYARFVFLKEAWAAVMEENDFTWIDSSYGAPKSDKPLGGFGPLITRLVDAGVSKEDIVELVRTTQYLTLFSLCHQLDDPSLVDYPNPNVPRVHWKLMQMDDKYEKVIGPIGRLHESVLGMDPTGREMRHKSVGTSAFLDPVVPDEILAAIIGPDAILKTEIVKKIWTYIKLHKLLVGGVIKADAKLKLLFDGADETDMFTLNRFLAKHIKASPDYVE